MESLQTREREKKEVAFLIREGNILASFGKEKWNKDKMCQYKYCS
jgi:hypothetical protein